MMKFILIKILRSVKHNSMHFSFLSYHSIMNIALHAVYTKKILLFRIFLEGSNMVFFEIGRTNAQKHCIILLFLKFAAFIDIEKAIDNKLIRSTTIYLICNADSVYYVKHDKID